MTKNKDKIVSDTPSDSRDNARPGEPDTRHDRHFSTNHLMDNLKDRSVRGGAVTLCTQGVKFVLQMGSTMILARLLTPADFGLVAMVTAVTGFAAMFKDAGLSMATVQREHITHEQVSTLFWINVALSLLLVLATAAAAPMIAWIYGEPRLTGITLALAGTFLFGGLTVQHQALLRRQMQFSKLAATELVSMITGVVAGIAVAWHLRSYWALVCIPAATGIANAIGVWVSSRWIPGRPRRGTGVMPMIRFGGNLTGFNAINYFARNADNMLIGWWWGAGALGLYDRAYSLLMLPIRQINSPIAAVAIPALSRLQSNPARYRGAYLKLLRSLTAFMLPGIAFLIIAADWLILLILGSQWSQSATTFRLLGITALVQPVSNSCGWLFVTQNRSAEQLRWGMIAFPLTVIPFLLGIPYGIEGVAFAYAFSGLLIRTPLFLYFVGRNGPVRTREIYRAISTSLAVAIALGVALILFRLSFSGINPMLGLIVSGSLTAFTCAIAFVKSPMPATLAFNTSHKQ